MLVPCPTTHAHQILSVWISLMGLSIPAVYPVLSTFRCVKKKKNLDVLLFVLVYCLQI